jgi:methionyl aminopeptidase
MIVLKTAQEIAYMRQAGRLVALTLQELKEKVRPGVTTAELDQFAEDFIRRAGAVPAFKGYQGYPATICASVNEMVVHGIPGLRKLENGDIISIDIGTIFHGFNGDGAATFPVGDISDAAAELLEVTEQSLYAGVTQAVVGNRIGDIGAAVQQYVEARGFSVVRDFVGHGIGRRMHEEPQVPNFGENGRGPRLQAGMTIAIEPMVNTGSYDVRVLPDRWGVVTKDGSLSAHFEHTVAVVVAQPEILTRL